MSKADAEMNKVREVLTSEDATFNDFLNIQLPVFDEEYSKKQVQLHERPFRAAVEIVQYCILEISNDTKEKFAERPWFKKLYSDVDKWYRRKYGRSIEVTNSHNKATGVVSIYQTPFEVEFPFTMADKKKEAPPESVWIDWPNAVLPDENVTEYVINPPNFENMHEEVKKQAIKDIKHVITKMRSIRIHLMTADFESDSISSMTRTISSHLEKSSKDILQASENSISTSFWEIQMSVEKILKAYISQHGKTPPQIHDLIELTRIASEDDNISLNKALLKRLPPPKVVLALRYAPQRGFGIKEAMTAYKAGLDLVASVASQLNRGNSKGTLLIC